MVCCQQLGPGLYVDSFVLQTWHTRASLAIGRFDPGEPDISGALSATAVPPSVQALAATPGPPGLSAAGS